jgi:two-component sensor histidine kinase
MRTDPHLPRQARLRSALVAIVVGLGAAGAAMAVRALLGLAAPGVEARFSVLFPAALLATLAAGSGSGWVAAAAGLAASEYLFGKAPILNLQNALSVAVAALSLALLLWLASRYRRIILARGREREDRVRRQFELLERSHGFMCVLAGPDLRYEVANPAYLRLIGQDDVLGRRLLDVLPETEPEQLERLERVRRTGEAFVARRLRFTDHRDRARRTRWHDLVIQPILAQDGSVEALFIEGYEVTDVVEAEERLKLVAREVDHRANNLLAVIQSIIRMSKGKNVEDLQRNLVGRVDALARAHELLASARWRGADLRRLIEEELLPYTLGEPGRARLLGPPIALSPGEAQALAMGLHELATNAAKYGPLSTPEGRIEVAWDRDENGARHIRWQEHGGPPVTPPARKGFGLSVLELTLRGVGGRTRLHWRPGGLVCEFDLPCEQAGQQTPAALAGSEASEA